MINSILILLALAALANLIYKIIKKKNKKISIILTVVLFILAIVTSGSTDNANSDLIIGEWEAVSMEVNGEIIPVEGAFSSTFHSDGSCTLTASGSTSTGTWTTLDLDKNLGSGASNALSENSAWMGTARFSNVGTLSIFVVNNQLVFQLDSSNAILFNKK